MTIDQIAVLGVIIGTFALFAWNRWRHDVVAITSLVTLTLTDLALGGEVLVENHEKLLEGFGHPAVITVAAVLVISRALRNAGVVDILARSIMPLTKSEPGHVLSLSGVVMVCSAFMNNVGALALMLPVTLRTAVERARSPSILLMPLAFASILGGMMTMIGTPPNIIIASLRPELIEGSKPYGLFDFSPVGVPIALGGVIFVALIGWRLIPRGNRKKPGSAAMFQIEEYVTEIRVPQDCKEIGKTVGEFAEECGDKLELIAFVRKDGDVVATKHDGIISENSRFLAKADPNDLQEILAQHGFRLGKEIRQRIDALDGEDLGFVEAVVTSGSPLEGRDRTYLRRRIRRSGALLAIARQNRPIRSRLGNVKFQVGDVLLLHGATEELAEQVASLNLLPLADRELSVGSFPKAWPALLIFGIAIGLSAANVLPMTMAFVGAALAYVFIGLLPARDIYREIDWPVIVLLAAMMPVSEALRTTGCAELIAQGMAETAGAYPAWVALAVVMALTMCLSDVINNAATALIMAPIAVSIAQNLPVPCSPDPFLMAVAVGASCAFLTPIGHQCNALILGPGGYRFGDYWRMGLPLEVLIVAGGTPLVLYFWPLA